MQQFFYFVRKNIRRKRQNSKEVKEGIVRRGIGGIK
jgi:hypothetical protein